MIQNEVSQKKWENVKKCQHYNINDEVERVLLKLKSAGLRATKQRLLLVKAAIGLQKPFCAEDIFNNLKDDSVDLATVYRFLSLFSEMGLLSIIDFTDGIIRYEYIAEHNHHHHHIVCTVCKSVEPIDLCLIKEQENKIKEMGYVNVTHKLLFLGTCSACAAPFKN